MFIPVDSIQIQTMDSCNAFCTHCPYTKTEHSDTPMTSFLFKHIIVQIKDRIKTKDIIQNPRIYLFAQNEPFLDVNLFERATYIKKEIPDASIILSTNALMLPNLKEKITSMNISELYIFIYGYDHSSFSSVTGINTGRIQFDTIVKSAEYIKRKSSYKVIIMRSFRYNGESGRHEFLNHDSPSGCYTNKILHKNIIGCRKRKHDGWLSIDINGNMYLCSMDWKRETKAGSINNSSIADIRNSKKFLDLEQKTHGSKDSDDTFLCKRCEWAIPGSQNEKKTLVFTSVSSEMSLFFAEWIISLREVGKYNGEILVLDYGLCEEVKQGLAEFNIEYIPCVQRSRNKNLIVLTRYIDILPVIKDTKYEKYLIVHFDVDIWFQEDINPLFRIIDNINGCLFATEFSLLKAPYRGPLDNSIKAAYMEKIEQILNQYGGYINGGFLSGKAEAVIKKLTEFKKLIADVFVITDWGVDQFLLNYLFDFACDRADGYKWNCVTSNAVFKENAWYTPGFYDYPQEKISGVHCFGAHRPEHRNNRMKRFFHLYSTLFQKKIKQIGFTLDMLNEFSTASQKKQA